MTKLMESAVRSPAQNNAQNAVGQEYLLDDAAIVKFIIERVLAMYYPQDVVEAMGPTMVLPGTQYHNTPSTYMASYMNFKSQVALNVKAGTVAITYYDFWHAWMPNYSGRSRRMLKFLFDRSTPPSAPSWHATSDYVFNPNPFTLPIDAQSDAYKHRLMWRSVWDWLQGIPQESSSVKW